MARAVATRRWIGVIDRRARLMAVLAASLALGFVVLALLLRGAAGTGLDLAITSAIQRVDHPAFAGLMTTVSALGFWPWDWLMLGLAVAGLWLAGFRRAALFTLATPLPGYLTASIKVLVARPRPTIEDVRVASQLLDFSYPSGHVVSYVSLYGFLFFLTYVLFKRSGWRTLALLLLALPVSLVGISRIYLGHHWVSDVLGGYALGTAYLLILVEIYRITTVKPAVSATETARSEALAERRPDGEGSRQRGTHAAL